MSRLKSQVWKIKFEKSSLESQVWKVKFESQVWKIKFDEPDFLSISNLNNAAYIGSKIKFRLNKRKL